MHKQRYRKELFGHQQKQLNYDGGNESLKHSQRNELGKFVVENWNCGNSSLKAVHRTFFSTSKNSLLICFLNEQMIKPELAA
jgi:rhamnose utilization protein RhaD (predicted bifunctional aldolase and dehydrogenase)